MVIGFVSTISFLHRPPPIPAHRNLPVETKTTVIISNGTATATASLDLEMEPRLVAFQMLEGVAIYVKYLMFESHPRLRETKLKSSDDAAVAAAAASLASATAAAAAANSRFHMIQMQMQRQQAAGESVDIRDCVTHISSFLV